MIQPGKKFPSTRECAVAFRHPVQWNAQGELCTFDWTLQGLQQLAFETEAVVSLSVTSNNGSGNQRSQTKENALAVKIEF
ncbi:hypothetical protein [Anaerocolumna jejuensis]|uniref:hypothetical protein n=1 Tax=Anaerocolumna jejuensis TaxID=259063 RepID=UPI0009346955|nr:hypothetical protein [Anaerocolumna jejuensis]